jgi:predicted 3-demethylubiquinone-9 3-methyltransferase (glyoxalase superfamily)
MPSSHKITPCLWFDDQAEHYVGIFKNSKIVSISRYGEAGKEVHKKEPGTALTVAFELNGQAFTALNGGPMFKFNEAVSFQIYCETQDEVDYYWEKLTAGGAESRCGWLKDKFGLSWQVIPTALPELIKKSPRAMEAMLQMKKIDIGQLKRAAGE